MKSIPVALAFLLAAAAPRPAFAQCPDGTPPPCGARPARTTPAPPANSVAVLYFDNLSRDTNDLYLAEGLTEDIIVRLGRLERLIVKSRNAVRRYRGREGEDPAVLGRELGVAHLVSGSLRRSSGRLRVTVELVRASTGVQAWAEQYDRSDADLLAIEEDIAGRVAAAIAGRLLPNESASLSRQPTRSPEAYDHFLRGNYLLGQRNPHAVGRAIEEYEAALRADPSFAAALARIGFAYALVTAWEWPGAPPETTLARGFAAVDRALSLDSSTADGWLARGLLLAYRGTRTFTDARPSLERAVRLDPRNAEAQHVLGWLWFVTGNDSAAEAQWHHALVVEAERPVTVYYMGLQVTRGAVSPKPSASPTAPWRSTRGSTSPTRCARRPARSSAIWAAPARTPSRRCSWPTSASAGASPRRRLPWSSPRAATRPRYDGGSRRSWPVATGSRRGPGGPWPSA